MDVEMSVARDMKLDSPIAYGRTAEIYAWKDDQVLKLFHNFFTVDDIKYEQQIAQAIHASGLPVPYVGNIVQVKERTGLEYQRMEGNTMMELIFRKFWMGAHYARRMAQLHAEMHASTITVEIPKQHERLRRKIHQADELDGDLRHKILTELDTMPKGDRLCHGDFHPGNILVTAQGEVIIDWIDSTMGNPLADLARTTIITLGAAASSQIPNPVVKVVIRLIHSIYRRHYFSLRPGKEDEYVCWLPIVAAARLSEGMPELERLLVSQTKRVS